MSQIKVNTIVDASGGTSASINGYVPTMSNMAGRNRIINGAMMIDQRNAGASVTPASAGANNYTLDRWSLAPSQASKFSVQQNAGSVTPPVGFINYLGATSLSAYSVGSSDYFQLVQYVEGNNCSDLAWGTANAKAVTLSFYVYSSLTGTFGGSLTNSAGNRAYPFTYTVSSANTWTQISVTITGDTTGTWLTTNGTGIAVRFGLGVGSTYSGTAGSWAGSFYLSATGATSVVGTSGATFYITGVQLEAGSVATPFEHRQYGQELALCQRYYEVCSYSTRQYPYGTYIGVTVNFKQTKRTAPTFVQTSYGVNGGVSNPGVITSDTQSIGLQYDCASGGYVYGATGYASAEL